MKKGARPLVIGNWKMNPQSASLAVRLIKDLKKRLLNAHGVDIVIVPPFVYLEHVRAAQADSKQWKIGAQDAFYEKVGAHTGEVSTAMLQSLGASYVIIGHSERRALGETDEVVNKKLIAVVKAGLTGIVCVGESERDHGAHYLSGIERQIRLACAKLSKNRLSQLVIAYEPIWAIGTGDNATPDDVHEMKLFIEKVLTDLYGRNDAQKVRIIYGGSVTGKNTKALFDHGMVDGFLVGGASIHPEEFSSIIGAVA